MNFRSRSSRTRFAGFALALLGLVESRVLAGEIVINEILYRPAATNTAAQFVELFNRGTNAYNLHGWQFTRGVQFTLPSAVLRPGEFLVVAADLATFTNLHPGIARAVGGWEGRLADGGETLTLVNAFGQEEDTVRYATEGDWGARRRGPDDRGHRGWVWAAPHHDAGHSLELIQPAFTSRHGQNWTSSAAPGGTPGAPNSALRANLAPLILEVAHAPLVPRSTEPVVITARVLDDGPTGPSVSLFHRVDGAPDFTVTPMSDDGQHGDGAAGDHVFGAALPAQPHDVVVEFYLAAQDTAGQRRTWPAPTEPDDLQAANCLYQVDDTPYAGPLPLYRLITTEAERLELQTIGNMPWYWSSDAQMNATFLSLESDRQDCRYLAGLRMRGTTTREYPTKSRHVNFPDDQPWRSQTAINLNAHQPHSQIIGSLLCQLAGVPTARARAVQVRENNLQLAGTNGPPYGVYAHLDALDSAYTETLFPHDPNGNLYRSLGDGNLQYLGEDPSAYAQPGIYAKQTHATENDWTDLIALSRTLNPSTAVLDLPAVQQAADLDEWLRYLAVNTLLANAESSLANGTRGDYALYRGEHDPRFRLLAYDLDATLGIEGSPTFSLFRATNNPTLHRLLSHPDVAPLYLAELRRQLETAFAPENLDPLIDRFLGPFVPEADRQAMKNFAVARNAYIRAQLTAEFTITADLPLVNWRYTSTNGEATLRGTTDPLSTRQVLVRGQPARRDPFTGTWEFARLPLLPGLNSLPVETLDAAGHRNARIIFMIWYERGTTTPVAGTLAATTLWRAADGPFQVTGDVVVPAGVTLTIEPGTSVFFEAGRRLWVYGRLLAEGTPTHRIQFGRHPSDFGNWDGVAFVNSTNTNRLAHLDLVAYSRTVLALTNSTVVADDLLFTGSSRNVLVTVNSSLAVRNSIFPDVAFDEPVGGVGIPPGGFLIFDGNVFGRTTGYSDIIDFTGAQRPGPVLQILNNTFLGGSDDALDLDGTDAHIEGNVFMHFRKNNDSTSESSAIATGRNGADHSELFIARNVFFDNDYDLVLKEGAVVRAEHNTFVASRKGSLCFSEPGRPGEAPARTVHLSGNIFWQHPAVMANLDPTLLANGTLTLRVDHSILPEPGPWSGDGNVNADPRFVDPTGDFHLGPGSPARGTAPLGLDMGAFVPQGLIIAGEPPSPTWRRDATLRVGGPGLTHYRYRLNGGAWSAETPISDPIRLTNLAEGPCQVTAIARNSAAVWQPEAQATLSRPWLVTADAARLRLTELLAQNQSAVLVHATYPDLVELHNDSPTATDLSGLSLTDDPAFPRKFTFGPATTLEAEAYLVLIADRATNAPGFHLGFALNDAGDRLFLFDRAANGGDLLDSIEFGLQVPDRSLARLDDGRWTLAEPTFGAPNRPLSLGDPALVCINEWLAHPGTTYRTDFVELYNRDSLPVALDGLYLTDAPAGSPLFHPLPPLSFMGPQTHLVLLADGQPEDGGNHLGFGLDFAQGLIGLFDASGNAVDLVAYASQPPDTSEGRSPSGSANLVRFSWPTPGAAPGPVDPTENPVVLNEVFAHNRSYLNPAGYAPDWIELYNRAPTPVALDGLSLSDRLGQPQRWVFPPGTTLPPKGFLLVHCDSLALPSSTNTGFGLSADGDSLFLFDYPNQSARVLDAITFGVQAADFPIGRVPDGADTWTINHPTPAAPNLAAATGDPRQLRLNEWMADPDTGNDWFELFNPNPLPTDLSGLYFTDDLAEPRKSLVPPLSFIGVSHAAYQVFVADDEPDQGADHVGFKLAQEGEAIGLADPAGTLLDAVTFGAQEPGVPEGRLPDGAAPILRFPGTATPGSRNTRNLAPQLWVALLPAGTLQLGWNSIPGLRYALDRSTSLDPVDWSQLAIVTATGSQATYLDAPTGAHHSFYRLRQLP